MKNILKYLVGCIISCIGTALVLVGEKTKSAFTIVSKTVTMLIVNYSLARARSAAIVNKTVTIATFCNQLTGADGLLRRCRSQIKGFLTSIVELALRSRSPVGGERLLFGK